MNDTVMMSELSWVEYQRRLVEDDAIVMLPVGAVEQHGPHMPLGTDWMLATEMARRAAERVGGLVAPAMSYGYKSGIRTGGGNHFCGTTSLDGGTIASMLRDLVREFAKHGAKKIAVIDGHYENEWFLNEGCDLAIRDLRQLGLNDVRILKMRYCEDIKQSTLDHIYPNGYPGLALEHGAVLETSMMLHVRPELVRLDLIPNDPQADFPPYDLFPPNTEWVPPSGVLASARGSTAEHGKLLVDEFVGLVSTALEGEFRGDARKTARRAS